jgi:hypothetical protein
MLKAFLSPVLVVAAVAAMTGAASADELRNEIAPTGKLRVAIAISAAGGAFWSTRTEQGAVPLNHPQALAFVSKFMTDALADGTLRKAYDNNGLKDAPIRTN